MAKNTNDQNHVELPADHPLRKAHEARSAKAAARAELSPRGQQTLLAKEILEELQYRLRYGGRRTLYGLILNAGEITPSEKISILDSLQTTIDYLRQEISSTREQKVSIPLPDFMDEE